VVVTETGARREKLAVLASGPPLTAAPLTVMVNEHTASASEIFAGALRDNCRALLVGTRHVPFSPSLSPSLGHFIKALAELNTCALFPIHTCAGVEAGLKQCMAALVGTREHRHDC